MEIYVREYSWMWSRLELNPAECRVYAYIYGLTNREKARVKGYQGGVRALASVLGLDKGGVSRILRKLQDQNLVMKEGDLYKSVDSVNAGVEYINESVENINKSVESVNSPITPIYIKKERGKEEVARDETRDAPLICTGSRSFVSSHDRT